MSRGLKTFLIWSVLVGIGLFAFLNQVQRRDRPAGRASAQNVLEMAQNGDIASYEINDRQELTFVTNDGVRWSTEISESPQIVQYLSAAGVRFQPSAVNQSATDYSYIIITAIAIIAFIFLLRRFSGGQMNHLFELRKSKARSVTDDNKARFTDIGGNREAVDLLKDIVDFIREPEQWSKSGARLPRGILVVGPPGTGKTLLARAVAGETDAKFFYASAAEFVEMFVGVGAARVRDTFEKAIAQRPAVIFIDEIDAIGRRRGTASGAMHEERETTLNQLLVSMDGLERHDRLVVIAATNRPDVLDPALLRSGRFDRTVRLESPDQESRVEILRIHTLNKPIDSSVSLEQIAGITDGMTGADLETLANDAALLAVRRQRQIPAADRHPLKLLMEDFRQALESMTKSNPQFDRLDSILAESVTQFAEPTGQAVARITLTTGNVIEGTVLWMNAGHIKLRAADGTEVIVSKQLAERITPLKGTESVGKDDFVPDPWAAVKLNAR